MTPPTRPRLALLRRTRSPGIRLRHARRSRPTAARPRRRLALLLALPLLAAFAFAGGYAAETTPPTARAPRAAPPPMSEAPPPTAAPFAALTREPRPDAAQVVAQRIDLPRWDEDRDGLVNPTEFARGLFAMADIDLDQRLTAAEFEAARAWLPGEPDPETIDRWDRDGDGLLDPRSFAAGVIIDQLASGWDLDGDRRLRRSEIAEGLRLAFDRNGDGHLQPEEQSSIARGVQ